MHLHKIQTTEKRFKIIGAVSLLLQETKKNMMMYKALAHAQGPKKASRGYRVSHERRPIAEILKVDI